MIIYIICLIVVYKLNGFSILREVIDEILSSSIFNLNLKKNKFNLPKF